ncbi:helix-turn-helix transcriptional regulator [Vagococcus carniphilus]|uniref:helix-turn-helix transcriptional regulator n=1 Tax=Vagococcus carniphilus TaxID=218144 RepID=UPI0028911FB3|nr:helix-turn-helix domain-containing protein [Vagococcus carniphilus]MDT2814860.1 helix-turn-helix domain-containing protein [Vagococcus carniphilus]MDT2866130.1 helix-turn-helix domain-containing protein [Vagococcus carniphilus]
MSEDTGNLISQKRKEKKLTQDDLAKELHVTRQAVSNWERNVTVPDRPTIEKLSAVLGANLDQLVRKEQSNKIGDDQKMIDKEVEKIEMPINKYDTAIGLFYAVSLFVGMMVSLLLVVLKKPETWQMWAIVVAIGLLVFLILGLTIHGIITLIRKDEGKNIIY